MLESERPTRWLSIHWLQKVESTNVCPLLNGFLAQNKLVIDLRRWTWSISVIDQLMTIHIHRYGLQERMFLCKTIQNGRLPAANVTFDAYLRESVWNVWFGRFIIRLQRNDEKHSNFPLKQSRSAILSNSSFQNLEAKFPLTLLCPLLHSKLTLENDDLDSCLNWCVNCDCIAWIQWDCQSKRNEILCWN